MKTKKSVFRTVSSLLFIVLYTAYLLVFSDRAKADAAAGLRLCAGVILPAVFPFSVASSLIVSSGLCGVLGKYVGRPLSALLGLSGSGAGVFFLGLVGGYPTGASSCARLYRDNAVSKAEAEALVSYTNNATPAFSAVFIGSLLGSRRAGFAVYLSCIASAFLWGLLLRKKTGSHVPNASASGGCDLSSCVASSARSAVVICADVVVFSIISGALSAVPYCGVVSALPELTNGAVKLSGMISDPRLRGAAVCALTSFSGLCVMDQVCGVCREAGLSARYYVIGKPLQALFSFFAFYLSYPLFSS
ncbi:MAG: hypothetical protein J5585_00895 [Clostridia bacterium]|nr:hypothetical protein [Clostridia bacterium]